MRVGITTLLFNYNYGSALQAYALKQTLHRLGNDAELIDQHDWSNERWYNRKVVFDYSTQPPRLRRSHLLRRLRFIISRALLNRKSARRNMRAFETFYSTRLPIAPLGRITPRTARTINQRYDAFVCGSDVIWMYRGIERGRDDFFLSFTDDTDKPRVAYAPSFYDDPSTLSAAAKGAIRSRLQRFSALSCREDVGCSFVRSLTNEPCEWVLDPTLLLSEDEWHDVMIPPDDAPRREYVLAYTLGNHSWVNDLACIAATALGNTSVYRINTDEFLTYSALRHSSLGPSEFLWLAGHAKFIVTNSYHGALFSVIFRKPFWTGSFPHASHRLVSVLRRLDLQNRIPDADTPFADATTQSTIDYDRVHTKLGTLRTASLDYLSKALRVKTAATYD